MSSDNVCEPKWQGIRSTRKTGQKCRHSLEVFPEFRETRIMPHEDILHAVALLPNVRPPYRWEKRQSPSEIAQPYLKGGKKLFRIGNVRNLRLPGYIHSDIEGAALR